MIKIEIIGLLDDNHDELCIIKVEVFFVNGEGVLWIVGRWGGC